MKTYRDGVEDAIALIKDCEGCSTEWLIDRLRDYQEAYDKTQMARDVEQSWRESPDRMGGQFTQDEVDNASAWR